ncbi:M15 family metallopeptidase [Pseudomonas indica]|uniref:D-alanyl-D-alanine dipeptidase n=1 Tax=Pseudomonas indica TaxID=137658 RepID=A0A1G9JE49_9PSED|nr:M15 family metallopeptidase [Pseudomonas indica]SDL35718.1 D-alanyl-D-alanine dipeptidase [Pseudomonas indica]
MLNLERPIPPQTDPDWDAIAAIPIAGCGEPMMAFGLAQNFLVYPAYYKQGIRNALPECHGRTGVFERLLTAASLLPEGVRLVVLDAWRPFAVQQYLYESLLDAVTARYPQLDDRRRQQLTRQFVSPPDNSRNAPSPHLTGGAVDVTLCDRHGRWLDMGTGFDEASPRSSTTAFEQLEQPTAEQEQVRRHRRWLHNAMIEAGFSNLPSEWWHYDFGDQLWAWHSGAQAALYGPTQVHSLESLWHRQLAEQTIDPT